MAHGNILSMERNIGTAGFALDDLNLSQIQKQNTNDSVEQSSSIEASARPKTLAVAVTKSLISILEGRWEKHGKNKTEKDMKRIRLDVLQALYVNRLNTDKDESMEARHQVSEEALLKAILSKSCDQVALVKKMLQEQVSGSTLILVWRLQRFTDKKSQEGMIGKKETRAYMRKLKEALL